MRILLVGNIVPYGRIKSFAGAFERLGCEVFTVDLSGWSPSFINRVYNKLTSLPSYWGAKTVNTSLLRSVEKASPDLIIMFKPIALRNDILQSISKISATYLRMDDNFFIPAAVSRQLWENISYFNCVLTTKLSNVEKLLKHGAQKCVHLPHAADITMLKPQKLSEEEVAEWGSDIVFTGSYEEDRANYLEALRFDGFDIKIWGVGWHRASNSKLVRRGLVRSPVYGPGLAKVISASKICLGFLRKSVADQQTARTYEIPSCQGFMLHERTDECVKLFREGVDAEFFGSYEEMRSKISFYLKNEKARDEIAASGLNRLLKSDYTIDGRAKDVLKIYKEANDH